VVAVEVPVLQVLVGLLLVVQVVEHFLQVLVAS
jgi:hypothetical protein